MIEIIIPVILFGIWTLFSVLFIFQYKRYQTSDEVNKKSFWNNDYVFENIPPVYPTLGIFCTALGITIGIWNFNTADIQSSIPELLKGLRLAFLATMAGIIGLIIFQKIIEIVQKRIENHPNGPKEQKEELMALQKLNLTVQRIHQEQKEQVEDLIHRALKDHQKTTLEQLTLIHGTTDRSRIEIVQQLETLREEQRGTSNKIAENTTQIIDAMGESNILLSHKFDEFSELLKKNNTETLVEVMQNVSEQFNAQMGEMVDKMVKENFSELSESIKNMTEWQKDNKEQMQQLTEKFQKTIDMYHLSASNLKDVTINTKKLLDEDGKLNQIIKELNRLKWQISRK